MKHSLPTRHQNCCVLFRILKPNVSWKLQLCCVSMHVYLADEGGLSLCPRRACPSSVIFCFCFCFFCFVFYFSSPSTYPAWWWQVHMWLSPSTLLALFPHSRLNVDPPQLVLLQSNLQLWGLAWHTRAPTTVSARPYNYPCQVPTSHTSALSAIMAQPE